MAEEKKKTSTTKKKKVEEVIIEKTESKPVKKKQQIDRDLMVACRNVTDGLLVYISKKSGLETVWMNHGDEEFIDVGELLTMKASQPSFLSEPWLVVDDEDVAEYLGLKHLYAKLVDIEDLDGFFEKDIYEMEDTLEKIPKGIKESIAIRARKKIEDNTLYDTRKIRLLEDKLKIDLSILL